MGFKSVMKKVGKVALKVAPYAAMAIPGVGIPLGMAIAGATSAANKKLEGGSWKQALISGGIGAGTGALGGAGGLGSKVASKIGPSSSLVSKLGAGAIGKTAGTGIAGKIGGQLGTMGMQAGISAAMNKAAGGAAPTLGGQNTSGSSESYPGGGGVGAGTGKLYGGPKGSLVGDFVSTGKGGIGPSSIPGSVMPRGGFKYRDQPLNQYDQSNPNLALALHQGRQNAIKNQPFRAGYDVNTMMDNSDPENPVVTTVRMPPIYPTGGGGRRRQQSGY